jgi:hypothetical protein
MGAQGQQPGKSKAVKGQVAPSARSKTTKGSLLLLTLFHIASRV